MKEEIKNVCNAGMVTLCMQQQEFIEKLHNEVMMLQKERLTLYEMIFKKKNI